MTPSVKPKVVVICGPTGIGKTRLSLFLAESLGGCVVSADSMQIYRHMDIGTAKPDPADRARVPHYLLDVADPDEPFDAARFSRMGREAIFEIHRLGKIPFVVGGTGFYIRAVLHGLFPARPLDTAILRRLREEAAAKGVLALHQRLANRDPEAAVRIHPHDAYRVIRALAVHEATGKPLSACQKDHGFRDSPFTTLGFHLEMERTALYRRIDRRVEEMCAGGLLEEVNKLLALGYSPELRPMQAIGYRHMVDYLAGRTGWDETLELLKRDTRRFAKRQLTWFKKEPDLVRRGPEETQVIAAHIRRFMEPGGLTEEKNGCPL